jgi:hypothetical protein
MLYILRDGAMITKQLHLQRQMDVSPLFEVDLLSYEPRVLLEVDAKTWMRNSLSQ